MMQGDRRRLELAYSLMMTLPGTPVLRYGDEIGMGDNLDLPERDSVRTPMQWSDEPHAGFTESEKPVIPVISEGPYGFSHVNVAAQKRDPNSLMDWTERIIRMRKELPEIGWGDFSILATGKPEVLAIRYDWRNNSVLFVHNLSAIPTEVKFGARARIKGELVNVLSDEHTVSRCIRQVLHAARTLWLPLVSHRRARLPPKAHRSLDAKIAENSCFQGDA